MNAPRVLLIRAESFLHLVGKLKRRLNDADIFEIDLDAMRVKGDLAVIQKHFNKPMIAKSASLDMIKKGIKAGFAYAKIPCDLELDAECLNLIKNKKAKLLLECQDPNCAHCQSADKHFQEVI